MRPGVRALLSVVVAAVLVAGCGGGTESGSGGSGPVGSGAGSSGSGTPSGGASSSASATASSSASGTASGSASANGGITITFPSLSALAVGQSQRLAATSVPIESIFYTVPNPGTPPVCVVAGGSMVTAMAPGTCTVQAEAFNAAAGIKGTATATFEVTAAAPAASVNQITFQAGQNGAVTGNLNQAVPAGGLTTPVTAVPDQGYRFQQWSDGSTANPYPGTAVEANRTIQAMFQPADGTVEASNPVIRVQVLLQDCNTDGSESFALPGCLGTTMKIVTPQDRVGQAQGTCDAPAVVGSAASENVKFVAVCRVAPGSLFSIRTSLDDDRCLAPTVRDFSDMTWSRTASEWVRSPTQNGAVVPLNLGVFHLWDYVGSDGGGVNFQDASRRVPLEKVGSAAPCPGFADARSGPSFVPRAVEAIPKPCYRFTKWSDGVTSAVRTDLPALSDTNHAVLNTALSQIKRLTAEFEPDLFPVSVSVSGQGSVTSSTGSDVPCGSDSKWTITPAAGWHLATATVDGAWRDHPTSWTFTNVREPHSIVVGFEPDDVGSGSGSGSGSGACVAPNFLGDDGVCVTPHGS